MNLIYWVGMAFSVYKWILIIKILLSWIPHNPDHPIVGLINKVTDPLLTPFRNLIQIPGIDLSPIIVFFLLGFLEKLIIQLLVPFSY